MRDKVTYMYYNESFVIVPKERFSLELFDEYLSPQKVRRIPITGPHQTVFNQPARAQPHPTHMFLPTFLVQQIQETQTQTKLFSQVRPLLELIAEPSCARSMSFVGNHEYLASEIINGEGHGSVVDWRTFGIFLYELLFGKTPFKGMENCATLFNVVGQHLKFPDLPSISSVAKDLIKGLLVKEPHQRLAYRCGPTELKQHPFFQNVNWALIRCTSPPEVPKPFEIDFAYQNVPTAPTTYKKVASVVDVKSDQAS